MVTSTDCFTAYDPAMVEKAVPVYLAPAEDFDRWLEENAIDYLLLAKANGFKGQSGKVLVAADAVFVGTGKGDDPLVLGAASAILPEGTYRLANADDVDAADLACLGWVMGAYKFERYKERKAPPVLMLPEAADVDAIGQMAEAVWLARDLVNTPTEDMGPDDLAAAVKVLATAHKAQVKVIEGDALLKQNFPLIHAVGRAAEKAPRLIDMTWGDKSAPKLTLVGKGVCFDTGGLNIKGGNFMLLMKKDMGGAANALALASMIMAAGLNVRLRVLIPAVENNISGNAYRPGDVFVSRQGMSVEISNTDAEGRLVLADALALAAEEKPEHIISLATLTGAARVALGPELAPCYSTDDTFAKEIMESGSQVADPVWQMPFWENYYSYLSSDIADVNHASDTSFAGSITAALFLKRFVPESIPYTHFDIFAWNPKPRPARPKGGEALGVRALFDVLKKKYG
jgi:leucyl aminopeptidase